MIRVALCLVLLVVVFAAEDYYVTLGLRRNASDEELKKAFKKLSIKYHPDKNRGNEKETSDKFSKVVNAYEILKDKEKKDIYDHHGEEGLKQHQDQQNNKNTQDHSQYFGHQFHQQQVKFFDQSDVYEIDLGGLTKYLRRNEVWIIFFFKQNHVSEQYKNVWKDLASKFYGIFKVASVDCQHEEELCQDEFTVFEYPSVQCYPANSRNEPVKYNGNWELQDIAKLAVSQMESFVKIVTAQTYEQFIAEDPTQYKLILFSNKKSTPPLFKVLSKDLKGKLVFGQIRQTEEELIEKFKITQYPTLMILTNPQEYEGVIYDSTDYKKAQLMKFLREYAYSGGIPQKKAQVVNVHELNEITLQKGHCSSQDPEMCLLYINSGTVPPTQLKVLQDLANFYSEDPIKFVYTSKNQYLELFHEIVESPAIVVIKPKRQRYISFTKSVFLERDIMDFVDDLLSGSGTYQQMKGTLEALGQIQDEL